MPYNFTPKTEAEVQAEELCPEGTYPFTVLESQEVPSQSEKNKGKPLIKLKMNVHGPEGFDYHIFDYIADWFMAYKFRHFFYAVGHGVAYEKGSVNAAMNALQGRGGYCEVGIEPAKNGYPAKNKIMDYVPEKPTGEKPSPAENPPQDDDVPF